MGDRAVPGVEGEIAKAILDGLARVRECFDHELEGDLPAVNALCEHVRRYRGKMVRPTLLLACGLAAGAQRAARTTDWATLVTPGHVVSATVCEMIHMATLVHDDVLDDAEARRGGATVNRLRGNEAAVILGDYLIAGAYHLCSSLDDQATARLVGQVSMTLCAGELLQLHHRDDFSLDEATYHVIVERKTASLIGLACRLGVMHARGGDDPALGEALERFGRLLGVAFQIQDDLLDMRGDEQVVGKSLHKDLEKGKLTLPIIHHLRSVDPMARGRSLDLIERAARAGPDGETAGRALLDRVEQSGSISHARDAGESLVRQAKGVLSILAPSAARVALEAMADGVVARVR